MNAERLKLAVENVLKTEDGFLLLQHFIEESGCFDRTMSFDEKKNYFSAGRKSFGDYILELIRVCDFKNFIKIHEEREK